MRFWMSHLISFDCCSDDGTGTSLSMQATVLVCLPSGPADQEVNTNSWRGRRHPTADIYKAERTMFMNYWCFITLSTLPVDFKYDDCLTETPDWGSSHRLACVFPACRWQQFPICAAKIWRQMFRLLPEESAGTICWVCNFFIVPDYYQSEV